MPSRRKSKTFPSSAPTMPGEQTQSRPLPPSAPTMVREPSQSQTLPSCSPTMPGEQTQSKTLSSSAHTTRGEPPQIVCQNATKTLNKMGIFSPSETPVVNGHLELGTPSNIQADAIKTSQIMDNFRSVFAQPIGRAQQLDQRLFVPSRTPEFDLPNQQAFLQTMSGTNVRNLPARMADANSRKYWRDSAQSLTYRPSLGELDSIPNLYHHPSNQSMVIPEYPTSRPQLIILPSELPARFPPTQRDVHGFPFDSSDFPVRTGSYPTYRENMVPNHQNILSHDDYIQSQIIRPPDIGEHQIVPYRRYHQRLNNCFQRNSRTSRSKRHRQYQVQNERMHPYYNSEPPSHFIYEDAIPFQPYMLDQHHQQEEVLPANVYREFGQMESPAVQGPWQPRAPPPSYHEHLQASRMGGLMSLLQLQKAQEAMEQFQNPTADLNHVRLRAPERVAQQQAAQDIPYFWQGQGPLAEFKDQKEL